MNRRRLTSHRLSVAVDPLADVAAYWKLDANTGGNFVADEIGSLDVSYPFTSGVTFAAGKNNNAFTHSLATNRKLIVLVPAGTIVDVHGTSFVAPGNEPPFSFFVWSKFDPALLLAPADPASPVIASSGEVALYNWAVWREYHAGNYATLNLRTVRGDSAISNLQMTGLSFGDAGWHHYGITRASGINARTRLYYDGAFVEGLTAGLADIGAEYWGFGAMNIADGLITALKQIKGQFDEAAYWTRELTTAEAAGLYNAGAGEFLP